MSKRGTFGEGVAKLMTLLRLPRPGPPDTGSPDRCIERSLRRTDCGPL